MAVKSTVGEIWPYGPMSTYKAEEKRKQEKHEAGIGYTKAMADYYRQGGSSRNADSVADARRLESLLKVYENNPTPEIEAEIYRILRLPPPKSPMIEAVTPPVPEEKPGLWSRTKNRIFGNTPNTQVPPTKGALSNFDTGSFIPNRSSGVAPLMGAPGGFGGPYAGAESPALRQALSGTWDWLTQNRAPYQGQSVQGKTQTTGVPQVFSGGALGGLTTSSPAAQTVTQQAPPGLESIWNQLDDEGKQSALEFLRKGATPQQLLEHYHKQGY